MDSRKSAHLFVILIEVKFSAWIDDDAVLLDRAVDSATHYDAILPKAGIRRQKPKANDS
jgi:hypothetical protein